MRIAPFAALLANESGSQAPLTFLGFVTAPEQILTLRAVKGNYPANRMVTDRSGFETIWFQAAIVIFARKETL